MKLEELNPGDRFTFKDWPDRVMELKAKGDEIHLPFRVEDDRGEVFRFSGELEVKRSSP